MRLSLKSSVSIWLTVLISSVHHQQIYAEETNCTQPGDVIILIDGSYSISDSDWVRSKNFVKELIDSFDIGPDTIHVGMVVYSSNIGDVIGLKKYRSKETLKSLAGGLHHLKEGTDTAAGIRKVTEMMETEARPHTARIVIVVTDGRSRQPRRTIREAKKAKDAGIVMLTVGVGHDSFRAELSQIATSEREMFHVSDFSSLQGIISILRKRLCKMIMATLSTTSLPTPTTGPNTRITPTSPLNTGISGLKCSQPVDVAILIDGSDSISDGDWVKSKNFVKGLIDSFDIGPDTIHVGIVVYSSNIGDVIGLKKYRSKETLKSLADRLYHPKDGTDTAAGIRKVTEMMETEARPGAARVAVIITDGKFRHPNETIQEAVKAKSAGIVMLTVGVGHAIFRAELSQIATSERETFDVSDFSGLQRIVGILRKFLCKFINTTTVSTTTSLPTTATTTLTSTTPKTTRSSATTSTTTSEATTTRIIEALTLKLFKPTEQPKQATEVSSGRLESLCQGCLIDRGIGYSSHPDDCTKYIQCFRENGEYRAQMMPCPFGTYWDQNTITCLHSRLVNCTTDPCLVTRKDSTFAMRENCVGYWSCHNGRAEAKCCERKHRYVAGKGCVPDRSCKKVCPNLKIVMENDEKFECPLLTDERDPGSYIQIVPGIGAISRPCAPGSVFKRSICSCAKDMNFRKLNVECNPSVSYDFNENFADQSGNNVFAGFERVYITENGTAKFSDGSRINIWRFANVEFGEKFLIKLRFLKYNYGSRKQTIVTNCSGQQGEGPSIAITTVENSIIIEIKSELGQIGILRFFQVRGFNDVIMEYDGQHVIAKVNDKVKSTALIGNIERRQSGLLIGDCDGQHSFHGEIDYFAVYRCLPNEDIFQRTSPLQQRREIA